MKLLENKNDLKENEVFVFGSNLAGRHGAGAALTAKDVFGAEPGIGYGPTGRCFAIPTKDYQLRSLPLQIIGAFVADFLKYARANKNTWFVVTPIGCGLAGYKPEQIAPMFLGKPLNVILPEEFYEIA